MTYTASRCKDYDLAPAFQLPLTIYKNCNTPVYLRGVRRIAAPPPFTRERGRVSPRLTVRLTMS